MDVTVLFLHNTVSFAPKLLSCLWLLWQRDRVLGVQQSVCLCVLMRRYSAVGLLTVGASQSALVVSTRIGDREILFGECLAL